MSVGDKPPRHRPIPASISKFSIGDQVRKVGGDYDFPGEVRSVVTKISGEIRYVVEDDRRQLHIFNEGQLERR